MYADIIVDLSQEQLDKSFQYRIPEELEEEVTLGTMVNVPFGRGNRMIAGYVIGLSEEPQIEPERIKPVDSVVPDKVRAVGKMIELAAWLRHYYGATMNQALKTVIPVKEKVRRKEKVYLSLLADREQVQKALETFHRKNARAKVRLLEAMLEENQRVEASVVRDKLNISAQTIRALEQDGLIETETETCYRNPINSRQETEQKLELNPDQKAICASVTADYDAGIRKTYLIHGVTGSGKTLVYMELIEHVLQQGRQAIVLIPEIALTFQTVQRFYRRFGDKVSILNSRMSKGERYDQFLRAMREEISIMIGPRSALFTPFPNLGLIVIDEEQEGAYTSEQAPRYHARETAIHIAETADASVVLGSATPSVDAYYLAKKGIYQLFTMKKRACAESLPEVYVEDLREELKAGNRSIFSRHLFELIRDRLERGEQSMLFLNKRGYAGFVSCRACGHVMKCPHCDISMTYHRNGKLICHYCGHEEPMVRICPECGSHYVSGFRAGTQQVEEYTRKLFPEARILRMDMDTTTGKDGHEKILAAFANHEADILIGTQMIVKGHDFPDVTLMGILAADMSLYASDFRAAERTFQLLTQAAGRTGRDGKKGEVIIQTYTPEHYSIQAAARQDYEAFYEQEIASRRMLAFPPVSNLLTMQLSSKNEESLQRETGRLAEYLQGLALVKEKKIQLLGPSDASIYKLQDAYRKILYARAEEYEALTDLKDAAEDYILGHTEFAKILTQYHFNE